MENTVEIVILTIERFVCCKPQFAKLTWESYFEVTTYR